MGQLRITKNLAISEDEIRFRFSRSGGPGGQNVNRRATQVELTFDVARSPSLGPRQRSRLLEKLANRIDGDGVLHLVVSEERSQGRNRALALERFRDLLAGALKRPKRRKPTGPSKAAKRRRLQNKRRRSELKRQRSWKNEDG
jgi:ribosome-associated protein